MRIVIAEETLCISLARTQNPTKATCAETNMLDHVYLYTQKMASPRSARILSEGMVSSLGVLDRNMGGKETRKLKQM